MPSNVSINNFKQGGFLSMPNDSIIKTLLVAISLCLICSVVVSTAAIMLKPIQLENKQLDKKNNIITVAGIEDSSQSVEQLFSQIDSKVVDLATGEYIESVSAETFDQRKASKDPAYRIELNSKQDIAQIGGRSKYANVYLVRDGNAIKKFILPIKGYGLWSTLYGFLCLEGDAQTACGINFYEHNETPGLGGEVDNPSWQALWQGKQVFNKQGLAEIGLIKGRVGDNTSNSEYKIDGLAGATLTSNGVTNLVRFWVGENGFGPYLQKIRNQQKSQQFRKKQREKQAVESKAIEPEINQQQAQVLQTVEQPLIIEEQATEVQSPAAEPLVVNEQVIEKVVESKAEELKTVEPNVIESTVIESKVKESEIKESNDDAPIIEQELDESQSVEPSQLVEPNVIESTVIESKIIESEINSEVNYGE